MPASRSQNPFSPPPRYSMVVQPAESGPPRGAIDAAGPANDNTNGPRRPPNNESFDRLLRIQQSAATLSPTSASPTSQTTFGMSPAGGTNDADYLSHVEAGPVEIGDAQERDRIAAIYQGPPAIRPPNATNYIQLVRMATTKKGFFSSLFGNDTSIEEIFCVDPHLNIPGAVLAAVTGDTGEAARRADRRRKNVKLEIENGIIDATIHLVADNDSISSQRKRMASSATLNMRPPNDRAKRPTKLDVKVTTRKSTRLKAYPLKVRLHAPNPRPPFHLVCTTDSPGDPEIPSTASPVTLFLPRNFRGPLRLRITAGNINRHISLSPSILSAAVTLDEDAINRGYFIGSLGEVEEDNDARGNLEDWKGDRVEINVEDGNVQIYYDDEELGWCERMKSNGWMWPREWS